MKKITMIGIIVFTICTAFRKSPVLLVDYRDAYAGNYFCNSSCDRMRAKPSDQITYADTLTISIAKDALDSILKITIGQNTLQVRVKNNVLYPYTTSAHVGGKFFANDSLDFFSSGLGHACRYRGKKK